MANGTSGTPLFGFMANGACYNHLIFTQDDDRVELQDGDGKVILIYDSHGNVQLPGGMVLGYFRVGDAKDCWKFISKHPILNDQEHTERHPENLLHFEMKISKQYVEATVTKVAA